MTDNTEALKGDQTLAMLLEFLAKLEESSVKTKVITKIKEKVERYVKDDGQRFGNNGYLSKTIEKCTKLRTDIVKSGDGEKYQYYKHSFDNDSINETDYAKHLINNIFPLFGCLYYMYFECSGECSYIEGGEWYNERCAETGKNLNKWLKDETGKVKAPDKNGSLMIERGFKKIPLSQMAGSQLFPGGSSTTAVLYFKEGAQLQYCLYYMLFLPDDENWNNAQSGHALLFLEAFCEMDNRDQFKDKYVDKDGGDSFRSACQTVTGSIQKLISSNTIVPVAHEYKTVKYRDLLEATHFWSYITWLRGNVTRLGVSLLQMESDARNWNQESLKKSNTFGPFPWGFVFKANWESNKQKLKVPLQNIITALRTLQSAIDKIEPVSSSAATVGGVLGGLGTLGAAGAAGAAAYSGLLGSAAEAIGRFFKGLLW